MDKRTTNNASTSSSHPTVITTTQLSKRFNREWIFRNFDFEFKAGGKYVFTGPNGSGKSTILQVLWGQTPQSSGTLEYTIDGARIDIEDISSHLAIATPYMDLIEEFTLEEQLNFHFKLKKIRQGFSENDLIDIMYLSASRKKYISNFSSGMKQRVKLGLAFYSQCNLLFIDEPGTNLDETAFKWYSDQIRQLPVSTAIFLASNDPAEYTDEYQRIWLPDFK